MRQTLLARRGRCAPGRVVSLALFGAVALLHAGCGTCMRGQRDGVYRGSQMDVLFLFVGLSPTSIIGDAHGGPISEAAARSGFAVGGFVDLPVSLVTDTLLLPYDLSREKERVSERRAQLRPLAEIVAECVPPGGEVLDQPPEVLGPFLRLRHHTMAPPLGEGIHYTIEDRMGLSRVYDHPGRPGCCVRGFVLEDEAGDWYLLVVRVRGAWPDPGTGAGTP